MSRIAQVSAPAAIVAAVAALAACTPAPTGNAPAAAPTADFKAVYLVDTELLEPPAVGNEKVFRLLARVDIDPGDPAAGQALGFYVTLAVEEHATLSVRLSDLASGSATDLQSVDPPESADERDAAAELRPFNDFVGDRLRGGDGVFWLAEGEEQDDPLQRRLALLIPEALLPAFARLDFFASAGVDGAPLRGATIELATDFFYLAVLGDSIQWGNGLRESEKISSRVAEAIERETGRKVIPQRFAQSGAKVVPAEDDAICEVGCNGEAPTVSTSITVQADLIQRPDLVELVLMDGCINDVGVDTIIDPLTPDDELVALTEQFCRDEMATLLAKVRGLVPQARIVVTGYFQIIGLESDLFGLRQWTATQGITSQEEDRELVEALAHQSVVFLEAAHASLRAAVETVNASDPAAPQARVAFADPGFGPEHAVFTPDRWLWSMTADDEFLEDVGIELALAPEDQTLDLRTPACFDPGSIDGIISCLYVSVGHPNPRGAQAYADAVVATLRDLGVL